MIGTLFYSCYEHNWKYIHHIVDIICERSNKSGDDTAADEIQNKIEMVVGEKIVDRVSMTIFLKSFTFSSNSFQSCDAIK